MLDALIDLIYAVWFGLLDFGAYLLDNLDLVAFMILAAIAVLVGTGIFLKLFGMKANKEKRFED